MKRRRRDAATVIVAGVAASAVGILFYNVMPLFLGTAQDFRGLSTRQIGLIGTVFFTGFTLTTAVGFFWIRRFDWRLTSVGAASIAAAGLSAGAVNDSYPVLLAGVFVAGGALSMIYAIGTTVLGDTSNPARWYGVKISAEALTGMVLLAFLPALVISRWGFAGFIWALVATIFVLLPLFLLLPKGGPVTEDSGEQTEQSRTTNRLAVGLALLGCLLFICGQSVMWSFMERLGNSGGYDPVAVGRLLAITLVFALTGSLVAVGIGDRFGSLIPLIVAHTCFFIAVATLSRADQFSAYAAGACLVMFSVSLGVTFAVTTAAELDHDGRYVVLTVPAFGVGLAVAPGVAGWLASGGGFAPVLVFGAFCLIGSLVAFIAAAVVERRTAGVVPAPTNDGAR